MKRLLLFACIACLPWSSAARAQLVLVTGLTGEVVRVAAGTPLLPFSRLAAGEVLRLGEGAHLQLVFLATGREEFWRGPGRVAIGESPVATEDIAAARVRALPMTVVRQLALTPLPDAETRGRQPLMRSIPAPDAIQQIETTYRQMRAEATPEDFAPELFLLAGMMENRQLERVEGILADIIRDRPGDPQVKLLATLYRKSLRNARESGRIDSKPKE